MRRSFFVISILMLLAQLCTGSGLQIRQSATAEEWLSPGVQVGEAGGPPRKLIARGTITRVDYAPPACGELIFAATFEIKLKGKLRGN